MATILTTTADYDAVRGYLGADTADLSDATIASFMFDGVAEALVTKYVATQSGNGVASVAVIMARAADDPDQVFLKAATAAYVAYLFTHGSTNALNVSVTTGDQTVDRGGIGSQWIEEGARALEQFSLYISMLTNWQETSPVILSTSGPTTAGIDAGTLSGFYQRSL